MRHIAAKLCVVHMIHGLDLGVAGLCPQHCRCAMGHLHVSIVHLCIRKTAKRGNAPQAMHKVIVSILGSPFFSIVFLYCKSFRFVGQFDLFMHAFVSLSGVRSGVPPDLWSSPILSNPVRSVDWARLPLLVPTPLAPILGAHHKCMYRMLLDKKIKEGEEKRSKID